MAAAMAATLEGHTAGLRGLLAGGAPSMLLSPPRKKSRPGSRPARAARRSGARALAPGAGEGAARGHLLADHRPGPAGLRTAGLPLAFAAP